MSFVQKAMRFVQFLRNNRPSLGVELNSGGDIIDLNTADASLPNRFIPFLQGGPSVYEKAQRIVQSQQHVIPRSSVTLEAPVTNPDKVICIGMNYKDHCIEQDVPIPKEPVIFSKFSSCIAGPYEDIKYPDETQQLDWEVELAIVIGKKAKKIKESDAMDYIFGYTVAFDVSARDWQLNKNGGQWLVGKSMDQFCPIGPAVVSKEIISDPHNLNIRCLVNGTVKQQSNTSEIVHQSAALVAFLSRFVTLLPGDLILTGTPPGVGVFAKPPQFLKKGDTVECEIEKIGSIINKII